MQSFAREFTQEHKGKHIQIERLGGFCLLLKRDVIRRIGLELDKVRAISACSTPDIWLPRTRQVGFNLAVCRDLFIHHFGTRTFAHTAPKNRGGSALLLEIRMIHGFGEEELVAGRIECIVIELAGSPAIR